MPDTLSFKIKFSFAFFANPGWAMSFTGYAEEDNLLCTTKCKPNRKKKIVIAFLFLKKENKAVLFQKIVRIISL